MAKSKDKKGNEKAKAGEEDKKQQQQQQQQVKDKELLLSTEKTRDKSTARMCFHWEHELPEEVLPNVTGDRNKRSGDRSNGDDRVKADDDKDGDVMTTTSSGSEDDDKEEKKDSRVYTRSDRLMVVSSFLDSQIDLVQPQFYFTSVPVDAQTMSLSVSGEAIAQTMHKRGSAQTFENAYSGAKSEEKKRAIFDKKVSAKRRRLDPSQYESTVDIMNKKDVGIMSSNHGIPPEGDDQEEVSNDGYDEEEDEDEDEDEEDEDQEQDDEKDFVAIRKKEIDYDSEEPMQNGSEEEGDDDSEEIDEYSEEEDGLIEGDDSDDEEEDNDDDDDEGEGDGDEDDDEEEEEIEGKKNKNKKGLTKRTNSALELTERRRANEPNSRTKTDDISLRSRIKSSRTKGEKQDAIKEPAKSYDELRERLRNKIEEFRSKRNEQSKSERTKQAREWRQNVQNKVKIGNNPKQGKKLDGVDNNTNDGSIKNGGRRDSADNGNSHISPSADINFNKFDLSDIDGNKHKTHQHRNKRKMTKQQMLKLAEARQLSMKENGTESREGKQIMIKSAMARARGEKVYDDPAKIRRSLKRDRKSKKKSAKQWEERISSQKDAADNKQNKRNENLKRRAGAKLERRKQKRLKKLLRPGFEGRKEGFINS